MKQNHKIIWMRLWKLGNVLLITLAFALVWRASYMPQLDVPARITETAAVLTLYAALYVVFVRIYGAYLISQSRISELVGSQFLSAMLTDLFLYVVSALLMHRLPPALPLLAALVGQSVIAVVWTTFAHHWYFKTYPPARSAILYEDEQKARTFVREYGLRKRYNLVRAVPVSDVDASFACLQDVEVVFMTDVHSRGRDPILKYCVEHNIEVYIIPRIGDLIMSGASKVHMFHFPVLRVARYHPRPEYMIGKRLFDLLVSFTALIVLSPLMIGTAIAVYACDRGPVFYRQTRLTKDGKQFRLLKFRSMRIDAEDDGVARLSSGKDDPRVTSVGRVIRKYRIDELPQLLNILAGDLSVVGPRPERPEIAAEYEKTLPEFRLRLQAKAGLTGYAQVYGKYNTDPYHKLQLDLMYIANPSFLEDLRICFATVKVLFKAESTEGVAEGMTTAMEERETAEV